VLELLREQVVRLRATPPEVDEVARRISQIAGSQVLADEGRGSLAGRLASQELLGTESTEEFVARIRQVTPDAVLDVARTHLDPDRAIVAAVGPPSVAPLLP
jgi:predicted Zn-dependent peptidase